MNKIRQIQQLNARELEQAIPPNASWHTDYRDTSIIYVGGLDQRLSEGDILTIFSQFGEPVWLKLARDRDTGKSKGFGWLRYEDQRSCDLAVDNIGGSEVLGRKLGVDHARYKRRDDEDISEFEVPIVSGGADGKGWSDEKKKERGRRKSDTPLMLEEDQQRKLEHNQDIDYKKDEDNAHARPRPRSVGRDRDTGHGHGPYRRSLSRSLSPLPSSRRRRSSLSSESETYRRRQRSRSRDKGSRR